MNFQEIKENSEIKFFLHIGPNYPINPPKVYCLTKYNEVDLCDGRDLLENIIEDTW